MRGSHGLPVEMIHLECFSLKKGFIALIEFRTIEVAIVSRFSLHHSKIAVIVLSLKAVVNLKCINFRRT